MRNIKIFAKYIKSKTLLILSVTILIAVVTIVAFINNRKYDFNDQLKSAYEGFVDYIEFGIGYIGEDIVEKLGDPIYIDYMYGGIYLQYKDIVFYTDGYINNDNSYFYGNVVRIETKESYGIKSGMNIDEAMDILGEAESIYRDESSAEGNEDDTIAYYNAGHYRVGIVYDDGTKIVKYIGLEEK